jgi:hypothetical protein
MVARKSYRPISAWRSSVTLRELEPLGEGLQVVERDGRQTRDTSLTVPGNGMVVALAIVPAIEEAKRFGGPQNLPHDGRRILRSPR